MLAYLSGNTFSHDEVSAAQRLLEIYGWVGRQFARTSLRLMAAAAAAARS